MWLKLSKIIVLTILIFLVLIPYSILASIYKYNPYVDISLGDYFLLVQDNRNTTIPGTYFGIHYLMESPIFKNLFSTSRIYSIYNLGFTMFSDPDNNTILFIPITVDIGYKFTVFKRFGIYPYAGWGLGIIPVDYSQIKKSALITINVGLMIRYKLWSTTYLKLCIEYGTIFGKQFPEKGYANYVRIIYPIPFIP